jgi:hypothetical protein
VRPEPRKHLSAVKPLIDVNYVLESGGCTEHYHKRPLVGPCGPDEGGDSELNPYVTLVQIGGMFGRAQPRPDVAKLASDHVTHANSNEGLKLIRGALAAGATAPATNTNPRDRPAAGAPLGPDSAAARGAASKKAGGARCSRLTHGRDWCRQRGRQRRCRR